MPNNQFTESLEVQLTDDERIAAGVDLDAAIAIVDSLKVTKKEMAKTFASKIEMAEVSVRELRQQVRTGFKNTPVTCQEQIDTINDRMNIIRLDTGEVTRFRELTASEKEEALNKKIDTSVSAVLDKLKHDRNQGTKDI